MEDITRACEAAIRVNICAWMISTFGLIHLDRLSPFDDPYGALLFLDFTAPKSKQYTWLLDFLQEMPSSLKLVHDNHLRIEGYPGLFYAKALCRWHHEEDSKQPHDQSNKDLQQAVLRYPLTCRILYEKIGFAVPSTIASLQHAQPDQGFS